MIATPSSVSSPAARVLRIVAPLEALTFLLMASLHLGARVPLGFATLAFNNMSGIGRSGTGTLKVDGKVVATQTMERTIPITLQWDESLDIGADTGTPVDDRDYQVPFRFSGRLHKVTIRVQPRTLTPAEEQLLRREGQRSNRASE